MANEIIRTEEDLKKTIHSARNLITQALFNKDFKEGQTTEQLLGCTIAQFKIYIEQQLESGYTLDSFRDGTLELDHKINIAKAKNKDEIYQLSNYNNIQVLTRNANRVKGDDEYKDYDNLAKLLGFRQEKSKNTPIIYKNNRDKFLALYPISPYKMNRDWATDMGVDVQTISKWKHDNKELIQESRTEFIEQIKDNIQDATMLSVDALVNIVKTSRSEKNITTAASTLLSYGLSKRSDSISNGNERIVIQIQQMKEGDIKQIEGIVIEQMKEDEHK